MVGAKCWWRERKEQTEKSAVLHIALRREGATILTAMTVLVLVAPPPRFTRGTPSRQCRTGESSPRHGSMACPQPASSLFLARDITKYDALSISRTDVLTLFYSLFKSICINHFMHCLAAFTIHKYKLNAIAVCSTDLVGSHGSESYFIVVAN